MISCDGRGGTPKKERGSGTSLSKAEGSQGEVSLLSANPAPLRASDNQTRQGSGEEVPLYRHKLLVYIGKQGVFSKGWTNHVKGQIVICHSCTNHVKGQILIYHSCTNHIKGQVFMHFIVTRVHGDHPLFTCTEIKKANQKF